MTSGYFHTSYKSDVAIFQTWWLRIWMGLFLCSLMVFPFVVSSYLLYIVNLSGIAIIGALGLNLLTGCTGQISLGHAAFLGIGAYSSAILTVKLGIPFWISMFMGGGFAAVAGLVIGVPSLRLKGLYLVITTMAFELIVEHVIYRWESMTGGDKGITIPKPVLFGITFDTDIEFYFLILFMVVVAVLFMKNVLRTKSGRAFVAIRDRDIAASIMGVNLARYKVLAFVISSFYAGVAGSLYASYLKFIGPDHFTMIVSIEYISMIIVGGMGTILGSIFGAVFMTLIPEGIRVATDMMGGTFPALMGKFADLKVIAYGLIIILFLVFEPEGLSRIWGRTKTYFKMWPFTY